MLASLLKLGFGFQFLSLRSRVRRIVHDLYFPFFLPDVIVNLARRMGGHFVTPTEVGYIILITCISELPNKPRTATEMKGLLFITHAFNVARCLCSGRHSLIQISGTKPTLQWNGEDPCGCRQLLINVSARVPILYFCKRDKNLPGVL